jgi:hypothetical protein
MMSVDLREGGVMSEHKMRLGFGILFLMLAGMIFTRAWFMPGLDARFDTLRMNLGGALALVLGVLNITRGYVSWSHRREQAIPVRTPLQRDPTATSPEAPIPELDFTKISKPPATEAGPPPPSPGA